MSPVGAPCEGSCGRQNRVVLAPVAGVKLMEIVGPDRASIDRQSVSDGGKTNSSPGRARHKPLKPLRREGRVFRRTCGLSCAFLRMTAGAEGTRLSLHPLLSRGHRDEQLRAPSAPRDRNVVSSRRPSENNAQRRSDGRCPARPCLPRRAAFRRRARTDNLPSFHYGILLEMRGAFDGINGIRRLAFLIALLLATPAAAEKRVALVIGNSSLSKRAAARQSPQRRGADGRDARRPRLHADRQPRPARSRQVGDGSGGAELRPAGSGRRRRAVLLCRPRRPGLRLELPGSGHAPIPRARPMSIFRWWTSTSCCARCRVRAPGSTW